MTQQELQNLLDGLDQGPLGCRTEQQWDSARRLSISNPTTGKGKVYKELTTGFEGTFSEMCKEFPGFELQLIRRKKIRKDSKYPNHKWIQLTEVGVKGRNPVVHFTVKQVKEIKEKYISNTVLTTKDIAKEYNVTYTVICNVLANRKVYKSKMYGPPVPIRRAVEQTCPHCGITAAGGNYTRWHGDKCKNKTVA